MTLPEKEREMLLGNAQRAERLGFDAYCTDCESATFLHEGRCGCGSGRVVTTLSLSGAIKKPLPSPPEPSP